MESKAPLVSVLIPTFNRRDLCQRAIRSTAVLRARGFSAEVVVVDDGSTDGGAAQIRGALASLPVPTKFIEHGTNRGLAHARRTGAEAAAGEWLMLLDSDNEIDAEVPRRLSNELIDAPPDVGVFWRGMRFPSGTLTVPPFRGVPSSTRELIETRFQGEYFPIVRRRVATENPWLTTCRRHACEPFFWTKLALKYRFDIAPDVVGRYETSGDDRFCAPDLTEERAADLSKCFASVVRELGDELLEVAPVFTIKKWLKACSYGIASGDTQLAREAFSSLRVVRDVMPASVVAPVLVGLGSRAALSAVNAWRRLRVTG